MTYNSATNASYNAYANNDSGNVGDLVANKVYANVNRYDDGVALYGAVTKVGNWAISADGSIAWQE